VGGGGGDEAAWGELGGGGGDLGVGEGEGGEGGGGGGGGVKGYKRQPEGGSGPRQSPGSHTMSSSQGDLA
jgi:hypothetical protein